MADVLPLVTFRSLDEALRREPGRLDEGVESASRREHIPKAFMLSQLSEVLSVLERAERKSGVLVAVDDRFASLLQTYLAKRAAKSDSLVSLPAGGVEAKFDSFDIGGWVGSLFTWWKKISPHPFVPAPTDPDGFPDSARVAVLGDWGTGLYGAPVCASTIAKDRRAYQVVVHLGDIYYSGDDEEVRERFLKLWPQIPRAVSRACNANHEMYTGGSAYFRTVLTKFKQKASYWALQNKAWILVGLDTAYEDHDLAGNQVAWLRRILKKAGDRRMILFTHHQPYSLFESQGPKLVAKLASLLDAKRVFAWYWGHEHRCVLYKQHPSWDLLGRCVGHSGFPYFRDGLGPIKQSSWVPLNGRNLVPSAELLDGPNAYIAEHELEYGPNGYLTLEFEGPHLHEVVHDPAGIALREKDLA